jgi:hypothetical protein
MKKAELVSIGLRAKTARAIAVVLGGSVEEPVVIKKLEISLADPAIPATLQPYHEVMELPWDQSQRAVRKSARAIERVAHKALAKLIREVQVDGMKVAGAGIVGAPDRDLSRIGNFHIRAHAAEGLLFRQVLDLAADTNNIKRRTFPDRDFDSLAAIELGNSRADISRKISALGRALPPPWRADEKQAATAAWLVLHRPEK